MEFSGLYEASLTISLSDDVFLCAIIHFYAVSLTEVSL